MTNSYVTSFYSIHLARNTPLRRQTPPLDCSMKGNMGWCDSSVGKVLATQIDELSFNFQNHVKLDVVEEMEVEGEGEGMEGEGEGMEEMDEEMAAEDTKEETEVMEMD